MSIVIAALVGTKWGNMNMEKKSRFSVYEFGRKMVPESSAVIVLVATYTGRLNGDFVGTIPTLMVVGGFLFGCGRTNSYLSISIWAERVCFHYQRFCHEVFWFDSGSVGPSVAAFMKGGFRACTCVLC